MGRFELISIIIPCYNVEDYIAECLDSVFSQDYPNFEVIVVDNNSTDSTVDIIKSYKNKFSNIILLKEKNKGASYARNTGLCNAKGKWIQFLDADDLIHSNKLSHQYKLTLKDPPFIAGNYLRKSDLGKYAEIKIGNSENNFVNLFNSRLGITSSNLFNKFYLKKVNYWNPVLESSQEADLMFRILKLNPNPFLDNFSKTIKRDRLYGQISAMTRSNYCRYYNLRIEIYNYLISNEIHLNQNDKNIIFHTLYEGSRKLFFSDLKLCLKLISLIPFNFITFFDSYKPKFGFLIIKLISKLRKIFI